MKLSYPEITIMIILAILLGLMTKKAGHNEKLATDLLEMTCQTEALIFAIDSSNCNDPMLSVIKEIFLDTPEICREYHENRKLSTHSSL